MQLSCQERVANVDDAYDSAPSLSGFPPSGELVAASDIVTKYIDRFLLLFDVLRLAAMPQNGDKLDFTNVRLNRGNDNAFQRSKTRRLGFDCHRGSFLALNKFRPDMPYVPCPDDP